MKLAEKHFGSIPLRPLRLVGHFEPPQTAEKKLRRSDKLARTALAFGFTCRTA